MNGFFHCRTGDREHERLLPLVSELVDAEHLVADRNLDRAGVLGQLDIFSMERKPPQNDEQHRGRDSRSHEVSRSIGFRLLLQSNSAATIERFAGLRVIGCQSTS
ncbi:MAG: hypothetical protein DWQ34_06015 [Planctomycetota bacterium]|nr:MAG: hypothetical protein DWQ34_06015 [Planctomycetota bacterium]